ncbi:MAG: hypothetical protein ACE5ID_04170 [Acidobacteriota bacterium]
MNEKHRWGRSSTRFPGVLRVGCAVLAVLVCVTAAAAEHRPQTRPDDAKSDSAASGTTTSAPAWPPPGEDLLPYPEGFDPTTSDPRAIALVISCQDTMGGLQAWSANPSIRFEFVVEREDKVLGRRLHYWDRQASRHRVEMTDAQGRDLVIAQSLANHSGTATVDGGPASGDRLRELLKRGYAAWVNDIYWLAMPFKSVDRGVKLAYEGSRMEGGHKYQIVHLTFDNVGLTPGDSYWAWIESKTRQMDYWSYKLEKTPRTQGETRFTWEKWEKFGPLRLSLIKRQIDTGGGGPMLTIRFDHVALPGPLPDALFQADQPVPDHLAP